MLHRTLLLSENSTICSKPLYCCSSSASHHCSTYPTLTFLQRLRNWQANPQETDRWNQSCNLLSQSAKCFIMACKQVISKVVTCMHRQNTYRQLTIDLDFYLTVCNICCAIFLPPAMQLEFVQICWCACIFFSNVTTVIIILLSIQGSLLPLAPFSVVQEDYRDAIKAAIDIFEIEPSANALDTTVLNGVKSDVCAWVC